MKTPFCGIELAVAFGLCLARLMIVAVADAADNDRPGTLRGTVLDALSGKPVPGNVTIVDATGHTVIADESFQPGFRYDGQFVRRLPAGKTRVRVWRGFETRALERVLEIPAGGEVTAEFRLERVVDLRARGWFAGDSHVHMIHGENTIPVSFDAVALAARAEDLQYLSLAQAWTLPDPTPERLAGELAARSRPDCALTWNLEAPKNYYRGDAGRCLGHCWMLGTRGRLPGGGNVIELLLAASAHDYESDKPSFANFESHRLIHDQGGAVFYTHPVRWWTGSWGGQGGYPKRDNMRISNLAVELPLDTLIGPTFDGVDVITGSGELQADRVAFEVWCLLLNHGYRVAATASSDACFDRPGGATPGVARTYTFLGRGFSWPAVTRATAQGRTFATTGPLLLVSVAGQPPGATFPADGRARELEIEGWPAGTDGGGLTRMEILRDGRPVQTNLFSPPIRHLKTAFRVADTDSAWYCVRLLGGDAQRQRAISGAFFFDAKPHQPPKPVPARIHVALVDAQTGQPLSGSVTEVICRATLPRAGARHAIAGGAGEVTVPAQARLRAEAKGYQPLTLSPFLDHPALCDFITQLGAEDLAKWETFERVRDLLANVPLTFRMEATTRVKAP
jgi:hypothetical protein